MAKKSKSEKIREVIRNDFETPTSEIVEKFKVKPGYVYVLRNQVKNEIMDAIRKTSYVVTQETVEPEVKKDLVNSPSHYTVGGVETIKFIEAKQLDYHLGNVVKYVTRANYKGEELQDLKKARWYLERAISVRENAQPT